MDFLDNIRSALAEYKMIEKGDAVVAALSGGADSVSLLHALTELSGDTILQQIPLKPMLTVIG